MVKKKVKEAPRSRPQESIEAELFHCIADNNSLKSKLADHERITGHLTLEFERKAALVNELLEQNAKLTERNNELASQVNATRTTKLNLLKALLGLKQL